MSISIYNTLTRTLDEFKPVTPGQVNIYVCGVTVYDECHLGHARSAFIFDFIRRYLKYRGYKVRFVKNITDVDDKIINKARGETADTESPLYGLNLNDAVRQVAARYTESFHRDMEALGIEGPDIEPKATGHIEDMIKTIAVLIEKGYAYISGGDVYFDVRKFGEYGRLSKQDLNQMLEGARVEPGEKKKDPLDFALWKAAKDNEPKWASPWGPGRPGWHIECSAMSAKYLGDNFDIHGGGRDLVFPHHENEIAQAECATGKRFANYWIHNGLLTINGEKMSKSLGNYVSIKDVLARCGNPDILKLFFLGTHYSHPIDFSWERIEEAKKAYEKFKVLFDRIDRQIGSRETGVDGMGPVDLEEIKSRFEAAMDNDFNTPLALGALFDLATSCNKCLDNNEQFALREGTNTLKRLGKVLGLNFDIPVIEKSELWITAAIARREELRKQGKFDEADGIRKDLKQKGIILEDLKDGTHWRRA